jgi:hypothetical protein
MADVSTELRADACPAGHFASALWKTTEGIGFGLHNDHLLSCVVSKPLPDAAVRPEGFEHVLVKHSGVVGKVRQCVQGQHNDSCRRSVSGLGSGFLV